MKKIRNISFLVLVLMGQATFTQTDNPCPGGVGPNATPLTVGAACTPTAGTTAGATYQANANNGGTPSCASPGAPDVWYQFTAPASGNVTIDLGAGTITDSGMQLYTGPCGGFTSLGCDDDGGAGLMSQITNAGLTPGQVYYVRVWSYSSGTGTFTICVQENGGGGGAPANDNPCSATVIPVNSTCIFSTYTNTNATPTAGVPAPGCASYSGGDVWFQVTVPASGALTFDSNTGSMTDGGMAIYSGTCGALNLIECNDDGSTNGLMPMISNSSLVPGSTIWIRFWEFSNDNNGTFQLCVDELTPPGPPPGNVTCGGMNPICSDTPITFTASTGGTAASIANPGNNYGCLFTSPNPTWYYLQIQAGGTIAINMSAGSDIDFALWGPFANLATAQTNCNSYGAPIDCSYSISATEQANYPGATAGQVYVLLVTNYANVTQVIDLNSAAGNTALTDCSIILPIELESIFATAEMQTNTIHWSTLSELANDHFVVERSFDGTHFTQIGIVDGAGNSSETNEYDFADREISNEIIYYRLKQVDFDGNYHYSTIISVNRKTDVVLVYPNPSSGNITIDFPKTCDGTYTLKYKDSLGKEFSEKAEVSSETLSYSSSLFETLPSGIYFVEISDENGNLISIQKVIKSKM
jgi:hypothetical protein